MSRMVKVAAHDPVIVRGNKSSLLLLSGREIWIKNSLWCFGRGNYVILPRWLARKEGLKIKGNLYHVPEPLAPVYDQEPNDDLIDR